MDNFSKPVHILCINSGSSSVKFALYAMGLNHEEVLAQGAAEGLGGPAGNLWIRAGSRPIRTTTGHFSDHQAATTAILALLSEHNLQKPQAVGHRLVSGGPHYFKHCVIDNAFLEGLAQAVPFAPLHLPAELRAIEIVRGYYPDLPHVACFDTAFHYGLPEIAARLPLPRTFWQEGLRKYGFHGLSYEYILTTLPPAEKRSRLIIAHLGSGASMAAVHKGLSVDTTMGLTPTGGFMMGSRSGDLDPGVLLYLLNEKGYKAQTLETLLDRHSGLLGVSELSSDMQTLLEQCDTDPRAAQAIAMFCYQARKTIGGLAAVLGGIDTLIFTGGIGEHAAPVRLAISLGLEHLGIVLDPDANDRNADIISNSTGTVRVRVTPTHEDLMIARHSYDLLFARGDH